MAKGRRMVAGASIIANGGSGLNSFVRRVDKMHLRVRVAVVGSKQRDTCTGSGAAGGLS